MSEDEMTCDYVLDRDRPETWGARSDDDTYSGDVKLNEEGVWSCPYDSNDGEKFCIFHSDYDKKSGEQVFDAFLTLVENEAASDESRQEMKFIGAKFGYLDFQHKSWETQPSFDISFEYSQFSGPIILDGEYSGKLDFSDTTFEDYVEIHDSIFEGEIFFRGSIFNEYLEITNTEFNHIFDLRDTRFESFVSIIQTNFGQKCHLQRSRFNSIASFSQVEFYEDLDSNDTNFNSGCEFLESTFHKEANFCGCVFRKADLSHTVFNGDALFVNSLFNGEVEATDDLDFWGKATFEDSEFNNEVLFRSSVAEKVYFGQTDMSGADFSQAKLNKSVFIKTHLENSNFESADLSGANLERAKLSNSDLFNANISNSQLYGVRLGDVSINTDTILDESGEFRCAYDPLSDNEYIVFGEERVDSVTKAMAAYQSLEILCRTNALPDKQSKFFARRQDMRRLQLRDDEKWFNYWFAEAQNAVFRHGESFSRIIGWSLGTILFFTFSFPLGSWLQSESTGTITYSAISESPVLLWKIFYHSTLIFLTGGGPLSPTGVVGEILTTIEALVAPVLLSLLIFVLGRRAAR